jgi:hypothetical protein
MKIKVSWVQLKHAIDSNHAVMQYVESSAEYIVLAVDSPVVFECRIDRYDPDTTISDDFETNYKPAGNLQIAEKKDSEGAILSRPRAFASADNMRFRGTGTQGTATKTTSSNIDLKVTETKFVNGLEMVAKNHVFGDSAHFQVVDVDNILGAGAGLVLDQFGTNWYLAEDVQRQGPYILPYPAQVLAGLYLRIVYNSVGTTDDVELKVNYFLHKKTA